MEVHERCYLLLFINHLGEFAFCEYNKEVKGLAGWLSWLEHHPDSPTKIVVLIPGQSTYYRN